MGASIDKLIGAASPAFVADPPVLSEELRDLAGPLADELTALLARKNGFCAFFSSLNVFPSHGDGLDGTLETWNEPSTWKFEFEGDADGALFFAEDVFGYQFAIKDGAITWFQPETAEHEPIAGTLEEWATVIFSDTRQYSGWPFQGAWESIKGPLGFGNRLHPITPFMLGGEYDLDNLMAIPAVEGMRTYGAIYVQTKYVPDGQQVVFVLTKNPVKR